MKSAYATLLESDELNLPEGSMNLPGQVRYGKKFTVRIDVHDKASDNLVCVYDAKTGRYDITPPRMDEIAKAVARRYGDGIQFFVIGMKPFE